MLKRKKPSQRKDSQAALASEDARGSCEHTFLEIWSLVSTWVNHGGKLRHNWPQDHQLSKYTTLCEWPVLKTGHHWNQPGSSVTKKLTTNHSPSATYAPHLLPHLLYLTSFGQMGRQSTKVRQTETWKTLKQRNVPSLQLLFKILYPLSCETQVSPLEAERHMAESYLLSQWTLSQLSGMWVRYTGPPSPHGASPDQKTCPTDVQN